MERLLTIQEVAEACRVSVDTVRFWRKHGTGPKGFRVGRVVRYAESDLKAWINERRQGADK
ncbi:helix-turn-helix transcriptional regulator [Leifsonia sp. AG29]|uniref:helix-turn-helix transcriptional regulator n=1 Tax=Leifsonia sp. AG29 TaxID=2598860 RepID=UPI0018EED022|nr:helix-turn-helix domain-containing protein [Leifsonia sp. AG29]